MPDFDSLLSMFDFLEPFLRTLDTAFGLQIYPKDPAAVTTATTPATTAGALDSLAAFLK